MSFILRQPAVSVRAISLRALFGFIVIILNLFTKNFFKAQNRVNIIIQASMLGVLALGMIFVMIFAAIMGVPWVGAHGAFGSFHPGE